MNNQNNYDFSIHTIFRETEFSDNRYVFFDAPTPRDIIIGADCYQIVKLPFIYSEVGESIQILYRQGLDKTIAYSDNIVDTIYESKRLNRSVVKINLSSEETSWFDDTILDTEIQLKVYTKEGKIYYSKPEKFKALAPINENAN